MSTFFSAFNFWNEEKINSSQKIPLPISAINRAAVRNTLFLHAMSGCDTTCTQCNQIKIKLLKILRNNAYLKNIKNCCVDPKEDTHSELLFLASLYESSGETLLPWKMFDTDVESNWLSRQLLISHHIFPHKMPLKCTLWVYHQAQ